MRPRHPRLVLVAASAAAAWSLVTLGAAPAHAQATLSRNGHAPLEVRTALALGGDRTTIWTQVHATTEAGAFALVVPVTSGAAIDLATDAWMEALEDATAVRVAAPPGVDATCPGADEEPIHLVGDVAHHAPLVPAEVDVVPGAAELLLWAAERQLEVPAPVAQAIADGGASHFLAMRFAAADGEVWTPTVRVALPVARPVLPLALAQASDVELAVTLFAFGPGRARLDGPEAVLDRSAVELDVANATSDYRAVRSEALAAAGAWLVESAGHAPLVAALPLPGGSAAPSLVEAYFTRADAYGAATDDPDACASIAAAAIAQASVVAAACPRGDVAVVDDPPACVEVPAPGETDPELLRCGGDADDLALALSGLPGDDAWLTRVALSIAPASLGGDQPVTTGEGAPVEPLVEAGSVDLSSCGDGGGGAGGGGGDGGQTGAGPTGVGPGPGATVGAGSGPGSGSGGPSVTVEVPIRIYDMTCGCSGEYVIVDYVAVEESEVPEDGSYYADDGDDCGGETSESYETSEVEEAPPEDDCGGDTSESAGSSEDDCGGDTSESAESSGDDCGGDTSDTSGDDGGDGDDSDDDGGDGDDSGDDGGDGTDGSEGDTSGDSGCGCDESSVAAAAGPTVRRQKARRALRARPRLSVMTIGLLALVAPLRRVLRPRRREPRA